MSTNPIVAAVAGLVIGAGATLAVSLTSGLLVTGRAADEMAQSAAVDSLVPLCVAKFNKAADAKTMLAQIKAMNPWSRTTFIKDKGWATIPGAEIPAGDVADACADQLASLSQ